MFSVESLDAVEAGIRVWLYVDRDPVTSTHERLRRQSYEILHEGGRLLTGWDLVVWEKIETGDIITWSKAKAGGPI